MGFFDELKKEISQAVTELVSDEELLQEEEIMEMEVPNEEEAVEEQEYFDEDDYIETEADYIQEKEDFGVVVDDYASDEYVNTLNIDIADLVKSYSDELTEENDYSYAQAVQMLGEGNEPVAPAQMQPESQFQPQLQTQPLEEVQEEEDSDDVMVDTLGSFDFAVEEEQVEEVADAVEEQVEQQTEQTQEYVYNEEYIENQEVMIEEQVPEQMMMEEDLSSQVYEAELPEEEPVVEEVAPEPMVEETSLVAQGMTVKGDIVTEGSVDIFGTVEGNVKCKGKLNVGGYIYGYCEAAEIYANGAHISGNIVSKNGVWIGQDSVIVGNIFGENAVIAGAIKGDIDIHGPVVVDSTAIVMGDIKSKSVQIEIGAAIEGRCSQCYADVSPISFFKENQ